MKIEWTLKRRIKAAKHIEEEKQIFMTKALENRILVNPGAYDFVKKLIQKAGK